MVVGLLFYCVLVGLVFILYRSLSRPTFVIFVAAIFGEINE